MFGKNALLAPQWHWSVLKWDFGLLEESWRRTGWGALSAGRQAQACFSTSHNFICNIRLKHVDPRIPTFDLNLLSGRGTLVTETGPTHTSILVFWPSWSCLSCAHPFGDWRGRIMVLVLVGQPYCYGNDRWSWWQLWSRSNRIIIFCLTYCF